MADHGARAARRAARREARRAARRIRPVENAAVDIARL